MSRPVPTSHEFNKAEFSRLLKIAQGERQQKEFAADIGMSKSYLNCYISGKKDKPLTPTTIKKIHAASGERVTLEELLTASGYDPKRIDFGPKKTLHNMDITPADFKAMDQKYDRLLAKLNAVTGTITNALASRGYKWSGATRKRDYFDLRITMYDSPINTWGFIYLEDKLDGLPYFPDLQRIADYAAALLLSMDECCQKTSFITSNAEVYENFKETPLPVLAQYASVILIDTDTLTVIKEEPIKTYLKHDENTPTLI